MPRRTLVQVVAAVVVLVFTVALWTAGEDVKVGWLRYYSATVALAVAALTAWDRWLWRWPVLRSLPYAPVDVSGTWRGTLRSLWDDPATGTNPSEKEVFLVVRQTATALTAVLLTDESHSTSTFGQVTHLNGQSSLDYMYLNKPNLSVKDRSHMHHGSTSLTVIGNPATRLTGRYWTDRNSRGELNFTERVREIAGGYEEACALYGSRSAS